MNPRDLNWAQKIEIGPNSDPSRNGPCQVKGLRPLEQAE